MLRKVAFVVAVGALAVFLALPAGASAARVKGKFVVTDANSVLGSAKAKPMGGDVQRVGLTLQHVRRADYTVYLGSFVDGNGNGAPDAGEERGPIAVPGCDLSHPSKKGHAGCVGFVT